MEKTNNRDTEYDFSIKTLKINAMIGKCASEQKKKWGEGDLKPSQGLSVRQNVLIPKNAPSKKLE